MLLQIEKYKLPDSRIIDSINIHGYEYCDEKQFFTMYNIKPLCYNSKVKLNKYRIKYMNRSYLLIDVLLSILDKKQAKESMDFFRKEK